MEHVSLFEFEDYLRFERKYSGHTLISYITDLTQFQGFLKERYEISDISSASHMQIRSWLAELLSGGISASSVNRKISSLRTYFRYLLKQGLLKSNPMLKITGPKTS